MEDLVDPQTHLKRRKRFLLLNHPCPRWVEDTVLGVAFHCLSEELPLPEEEQLPVEDMVEPQKQSQGHLYRVKRFLLLNHPCPQ